MKNFLRKAQKFKSSTISRRSWTICLRRMLRGRLSRALTLLHVLEDDAYNMLNLPLHGKIKNLYDLQRATNSGWSSSLSLFSECWTVYSKHSFRVATTPFTPSFSPYITFTSKQLMQIFFRKASDVFAARNPSLWCILPHRPR